MSDNRVLCNKCGFHYFKPGVCAVCKLPKPKKQKKQSKGQKQTKGSTKKGKQ